MSYCRHMYAYCVCPLFTEHVIYYEHFPVSVAELPFFSGHAAGCGMAILAFTHSFSSLAVSQEPPLARSRLRAGDLPAFLGARAPPAPSRQWSVESSHLEFVQLLLLLHLFCLQPTYSSSLPLLRNLTHVFKAPFPQNGGRPPSRALRVRVWASLVAVLPAAGLCITRARSQVLREC